MRKRILILVSVLFYANTFAQSVPQGINYQAVARDATGDELMNHPLDIKLSIISDITTSPHSISWQEIHQDTTNTYGLFTAIIGQGTSTSVGFSPTFDVVDWGVSNHFLKVEIDYGSGYTDMGTTAFMSVPYSIYSQNPGPPGPPGIQGIAGNDGVDGTDGIDGAVGATGPPGPQGLTGTAGPPGPQGMQGIAGDDGIDGVDGQGGITNAGTGISVTGAGTSVSPYVVSTVGCTYSVGDLVPALGGYIFYLDGSGCHGLVAKATDEAGFYQWSSTNFSTWAYASGIYGGAQNTKKIIARAVANSSICPAASVCDNLASGGYTDWYLPSKDELDMMYVNLHLQGLGGFANYPYWSSTEFDLNRTWRQAGGDLTNDFKGASSNVRAVRTF